MCAHFQRPRQLCPSRPIATTLLGFYPAIALGADVDPEVMREYLEGGGHHGTARALRALKRRSRRLAREVGRSSPTHR